MIPVFLVIRVSQLVHTHEKEDENIFFETKPLPVLPYLPLQMKLYASINEIN